MPLILLKRYQRYQDGEPDGEDGLVSCIPFARNQPGIEVFFKELKENTFAKHDCMTISEAYGVSYDKLGIYIGENGCFDSMLTLITLILILEIMRNGLFVKTGL